MSQRHAIGQSQEYSNAVEQPTGSETGRQTQHAAGPEAGRSTQQAAGQTQPGTGADQYDGQMFPTGNYLSEPIRRRSIETLTRALADATVLASHARYAHWNVKGMSFVGLHELFEEIAETFDEHVDALAERITALGGEALGTTRMAADRCTIPPFPQGVVTGPQFVEALTERLAVHDANLSGDIETATDAGDVDTADLLNELSRDVSQYLWFLEAHLQTQPIASSQTGTERPPITGQ
jgi:starvation-inducible DNA-binding protein